MSEKDCIFCKIAQKEMSAEIVKESDNFLAIKDINQTYKGHTLVIPKKHGVTLLDIPDARGNELLQFTKDVAEQLMSEKFGDGFNLVMNNLEVAGQVVPHAHIHIIPRTEGDGIKIVG